MKKQLIECYQKNSIECDFCDYCIPNLKPYEIPNEEEDRKYINQLCPKCGNNLLTEEQFSTFYRINKIVKFINKYFSWLIFDSDEDDDLTCIKIKVK